jgi:hypothetical protein
VSTNLFVAVQKETVPSSTLRRGQSPSFECEVKTFGNPLVFGSVIVIQEARFLVRKLRVLAEGLP